MPKTALKRLKVGAQETLESSLDTATFIAFFARVYSLVLFPILLTFWLTAYLSLEEGEKITPYMMVFAVACVIIQIAFFWHIHRLDKMRTHSLEDINTIERAYNELGEEYNKIRKELISSNKSNIYQKNCLHFTSLNVENAIQRLHDFEAVIFSEDTEEQMKLIGESDTFNDALRALVVETERQLIWPLVSLRDELFNYQSDALYNIALYRYSLKDNLLHCKARFCDDRITRRDRPWKPGLGHVGLAYVQGEIKFCNDVEISSELKTEKVDGKIIYRSFVSVPITSVDKDMQDYGVLVLTSRHANQFDIDKDQIFLILLSKQISLYYTVVEALILKLNQMNAPTAPEEHTHEEEPNG